MSRTSKIAALLFGAAVLLCCALLIRHELRAIAREIRDKPWPRMPQAINIKEVTVGRATIEGGPSATNGTNSVKITIENMKLNTTGGTNTARIAIENINLDLEIPQATKK